MMGVCVCVFGNVLSVHASLYVCIVPVLLSSVLLDSVFSNPEWSCHPADSSHVGRVWGANLRFALPLAGQNNLHTVSPHDHLPKVWGKLVHVYQNVYTFHCLLYLCFNTASVFLPGYPTRSTWEPSLLACSIPCSASMEKYCLISLTNVSDLKFHTHAYICIIKVFSPASNVT